MKNVLITGATGNVGRAIIDALEPASNTRKFKIIAAVRDVVRAQGRFPAWGDKLAYRHFDFEDSRTYQSAITGIDCLILLRPPHLADVEAVFVPLLDQVKASGVQEVIFLSVQGVEKSRVIPHHKIERAILERAIPYAFVRPSYFMQNLTTSLLRDIRDKRAIILPAGKAAFNWIDVQNIGEVIAQLIDRFQEFSYTAIDLTGYENKSFDEVTAQMNKLLGTRIEYRNVNPIQFGWVKRSEGMPWGKILVLLLLHYLPRFQAAPPVSTNYEKIVGKKPTRLEEFIERERSTFLV